MIPIPSKMEQDSTRLVILRMAQCKAHVSLQSPRQKHLDYGLRSDELSGLMYSECSLYGQLAPLALSLKQSRILWQGTCGGSKLLASWHLGLEVALNGRRIPWDKMYPSRALLLVLYFL